MGDLETRTKFVHAVDEAMGDYLLESNFGTTVIAGHEHLKTITRNADLLAKTLEKLDRGTASILVQKLWLSTDRTEAISVDVLEADIERMRAISTAARDLTKKRPIKGKGRAANALTVALITRAANAYATSFGTAPSSSRAGIFVGLLSKIFKAADIDPPGESRVGRILERLSFEGVRRPKRGRRKAG